MEFEGRLAHGRGGTRALPSAIALTARSSNALIMSEMRGHTGHFAEPSIWTASVELERTRVGFSIGDCGTAVGQLTV